MTDIRLQGDFLHEPLAFADSPLARACAQPFMLGLFLPTQSGGWTASSHPRSTDWSFDYNLELARTAEHLGFDLLFAVAQWLRKGGHGGKTEFQGISLDPFMTTAALTTATQRILLISTLHILYGPWHPLMLAKFGATLDHISQGRWGINVVTGHRPAEFERFGQSPIEHDQRYQRAGEFLDLLKYLWSDTPELTWSSEHYRLKDAYVGVKPRYGRPALINATGSSAGIAFAARHSDIVFATSPAGSSLEQALQSLPEHIRQIKQAAAAEGRSIKVIVNPLVISRPTEQETEDYLEAILDGVDEGAFGPREASDAHAWRGHKNNTWRDRVLGGNLNLIGTPEQILDAFLRLKAIGVDGVQLSFYDFKPDLDYFGQAILPLLKQAGLRLEEPDVHG